MGGCVGFVLRADGLEVLAVKGEAVAPSPPTMAARLGHAVKWDPPSLETKVDRWTCVCGAAVLRYGGNVYGSALTEQCTACPTCHGTGRAAARDADGKYVEEWARDLILRPANTTGPAQLADEAGK